MTILHKNIPVSIHSGFHNTSHRFYTFPSLSSNYRKYGLLSCSSSIGKMALMKRTMRFFIHLPPLQHHEHVFPLPKRDFLANDVRENIIIIEKKKERERRKRLNIGSGKSPAPIRKSVTILIRNASRMNQLTS